MKIISLVTSLCAALSIAAQADPANEVWQLSLAGAVKGGKGDQPLTLNVVTQNGKAVRGIVQGFNAAVHDVDVTGLKVERATMKGSAKVTLNPDSWIPADKKPITCTYSIEATLSDNGDVIGNCTGKFGPTDVAGAVTGELGPVPAEIKTGKVEFRLENAINSQKPHLRSAVIAFTWRDGKAVEPKIAWTKPDKFHWTGKITANDLKLTPAGLTGTVTADIATGSQGEVEPGKYVFSVDGVVAGNLVAGKFTAKLGDKDLSGGTFAGTVK